MKFHSGVECALPAYQRAISRITLSVSLTYPYIQGAAAYICAPVAPYLVATFPTRNVRCMGEKERENRVEGSQRWVLLLSSYCCSKYHDDEGMKGKRGFLSGVRTTCIHPHIHVHVVYQTIKGEDDRLLGRLFINGINNGAENSSRCLP